MTVTKKPYQVWTNAKHAPARDMVEFWNLFDAIAAAKAWNGTHLVSIWRDGRLIARG